MIDNFRQKFNDWLHACQTIVDRYRNHNFPNLDRPVLSVAPGKRYWKVIETDNSAKVWAFVDSTNGDILKPEGWRKPAKHARGNLNDSWKGLRWVGPYGPAYYKSEPYACCISQYEQELIDKDLKLDALKSLYERTGLNLRIAKAIIDGVS